MFKKLFFISLLATSCYAKEHTIPFLVDENSKEYISLIKEESISLFSNEDSLLFEVKVCKGDCLQSLQRQDVFALFKLPKKVAKKNGSYTITYNNIDNEYDKNRVIRSVALGIYDFLKEKRSASIYIKNEVTKKIEKENRASFKIIDLKDVFSYIKNNNLDMKLNKNSTKLSSLDINMAQTAYKPTLNIYSNYAKIDKDRAKYSNGLASQESFEAGVKLSQLIYSNKVLQNIKINKLLYASSKSKSKALDDEVVYKATLVYLNIIKAQKHFEIINIKHHFISQNLMFAKQRVKIGVQDRSDIYRWESELSNANIEQSNAKKVLKTLKIELFNLLQIEDNYIFKEYGMNSQLFKLLGKDAITYLEDKRVQDAFTKQLVHYHARLQQLKQLEKAKYEELSMNKESRYLPTVAFEADAKKVLDRSGEGESFDRPWDDEEYQAVININLPLYEGGAKDTKIQKNEIELINLKLNYKNIRNLIIENVRKNYESLSRSYEKIFFSKQAEKSSRKNFELIQDKYKNGEENIITLLDAQNAYIVSKLNLNISITEYLSDLSSIYFFSGKIDILVDEQTKKRVEDRIVTIIKGEK